MGSITYDGTKVHFDDRTLTHLQIVIVQKLNRQESFLLSWKDSKNVGDGRTAIWLSPGTPLLFKFSGSRVPAVDREWLEKLGQSADSTRGLVVTDAEGKLVEADATDDQYPGNLYH